MQCIFHSYNFESYENTSPIKLYKTYSCRFPFLFSDSENFTPPPPLTHTHTEKRVKDTIEAFNWEILAHAAYSPDLAPSDYHLFASSLPAQIAHDNYIYLKTSLKAFVGCADFWGKRSCIKSSITLDKNHG